MNHYEALLMLSLGIAVTFALISREERRERLFYFLKLFGYMAGGSLFSAWLMYWIA